MLFVDPVLGVTSLQCGKVYVTATMAKGGLIDWLRRQWPKMPTREEMESNKYLAPIAHRFGRSELWRFTRRSVPRGVALGLFAGFIIPVGQIFLAAFLALPLRANVPTAALLTFLTNPFTVPFWLMVANEVGAFVLHVDSVTGGLAQSELDSGRWRDFGWFQLLEGVGVTAFGFVVLSVVSAVIGYVLSGLVWRVLVSRKWSRRPARRKVLSPAE